jgi:hypothetical protein
VKVIRVASIVTLLVVILSVCLVSAVSALEQNEIEVLTFKSDVVKVPGEIFGIRILINSTTNQELTISAVGIHLDWMDKDELYGLNYANSPVILEAGEKYNVDIINFTVPIGTSSGNHSYFVGIDGYEDDGTAFSWTSSENSENVISVAGSSSSNPPTSTATPSGQPGQNMDLTLIIFGVVLVVVIVIGILIVVMRKKRAPTSVESNADQTAPMKPDEGQDFNI